MQRSLISALCLGVGLLVTVVHTWAADAWPVRPVRIIVPFAAGGGVDAVARALAAQLTDELHQTVLVENRTGAGGLIGTDYVAKSPPDGYTLLMGTQTTLAVAPLLNKSTRFDPLKAFAGTSLVASSPMLLVAHPSFAPRSVQEVVALAKTAPGKINYGSGGIGTTPHMAGALLGLSTGIDLTHVAYKGEQPALMDVMGNQIPMMFSNLSVALPLVQNGSLRAIAISTATRSPAAPSVPTVAESGVPDFDAATWFGVVAPKETPIAVIDKLSVAIGNALDNAKLQQTLLSQGATMQKSTPAQFDAYMASEYKKWAEVINKANIVTQ